MVSDYVGGWGAPEISERDMILEAVREIEAEKSVRSRIRSTETIR